MHWNRVKPFAALWALAGMLLASAALAAPSLNIGDPAPAMKVAKWVKGEPVSAFSKGKVYVVEFWATWCGPCKQSIPHLTELAKKYKGKVTFTGISVSETEPGDTSTAYMDKVAKFVKDMGDKMVYNVGLDGPQATMAKTWLAAAGENGIPSAFIVGKDSKIAWIGHPMFGLDETLGKVIADKYDAKTAAEERAKAKAEEAKQQEESQKMQELFGKSIDLFRSGKYPEALDDLNKNLAANSQYEKQLAMLRFGMMTKVNEKDAYAYAKKLAEGDYKDNPQALNALAWNMVDDRAKLKTPDYDLAETIAKRAVEVSKGEDGTIMDTLAYVYFKKGDTGKAVETEQKAIQALDKQKEVPDEARQELKAHLTLFQKKK